MKKLHNTVLFLAFLALNSVETTYSMWLVRNMYYSDDMSNSGVSGTLRDSRPQRADQQVAGTNGIQQHNNSYISHSGGNQMPHNGFLSNAASGALGLTKSLVTGALFGGGGMAGGSMLGTMFGQMGSSFINSKAHKEIAKTELEKTKVLKETEEIKIEGHKEILEQSKNAQIEMEKVQAEQKMRVLSFEDDLKKPKYIDAIIQADAIKPTVFVPDRRVDPQISQLIDDTNKGYSTEPLSMLLFGPPGTGKTSRVMKSAREMGKTLVKINTPDLFQTKTDPAVLNKQLKELLVRDDVMIYFEEGDLLLMNRDILYSMNLDPRITTTILQAFSGSSDRKAHVIVDSNLKDGSKFDAASLRRFHQQFYIQNPNQEMIKQLLVSYKKDVLDPVRTPSTSPVNRNRPDRFDPFSDLKIRQYARQLDGANCDHIKKMIQQVEATAKRNNGKITQQDVDMALTRIKTNIAFAKQALNNTSGNRH